MCLRGEGVAVIVLWDGLSMLWLGQGLTMCSLITCISDT